MTFQWDSAKRISNLDKHGIDFNKARDIFAQLHVILKTYENRELAIGIINDRIVTVVYE